MDTQLSTTSACGVTDVRRRRRGGYGLFRWSSGWLAADIFRGKEGAAMEVGFFFWPYGPDLVRRMAKAADHYGFDLIGIADTPGNAMDPWVAATMVAETTERARLAICVSNLAFRRSDSLTRSFGAKPRDPWPWHRA